MSATEDVFTDHFPGRPILPGALIVEAFAQAAQLLIAVSSDFQQVGRLTRLARAAFRHVVRPGDQLRIRCERRAAEAWILGATADVGERRVASATLEYALEAAPAGTAAGDEAARLRDLVRALEELPLDRWMQGRDA